MKFKSLGTMVNDKLLDKKYAIKLCCYSPNSLENTLINHSLNTSLAVYNDCIPIPIPTIIKKLTVCRVKEETNHSAHCCIAEKIMNMEFLYNQRRL